jgi:hypothetical protein
MTATAIFAFMAWFAVIGGSAESSAVKAGIRAAQFPQGTDQGMGGVPHKVPAPSLRFDESSKRFVLKNEATVPIWVFGYTPTSPITTLDRMTRKGWVSCRWNFCLTDAEWHPLGPGESMSFSAGFSEEDIASRPDPDMRYPDLERLPLFRISVSVSADANGKTSRQLWMEKLDLPTR